jgi:hypothetical protein
MLSTLFVLALLLGACAGSDDRISPASSGYDGDSAGTNEEAAGGGSGDSGSYESGPQSDGSNDIGVTGTTTDSLGEPGADEEAPALRSSSLVDLSSNVIKTATVELEVENNEFQEAVDKGTSTAQKYGGFIITATVEDGDKGHGTIILRVPSRNFGAAMNDLHALGDIRREVTSGEDVSADFIDLRARLRHRRAQEAAMLKLLDEPIDVDETIRVRSELDQIQVDIERLRGQLRFLNDQTRLSTIEVIIVEAGAVPREAGQIEEAWARATSLSITILSGVITTLGVLVPLALMLAIVLLIFAKLRPKLNSWQSPP